MMWRGKHAKPYLQIAAEPVAGVQLAHGDLAHDLGGEMNKYQATGIALFFWMIFILQVTSHPPEVGEMIILLILALLAYGLIVWEDKR
jgi:Na+/H+-dicarboxylate symporter